MKTERIELNPKVMMGKPVIRGTRLTVEMIVSQTERRCHRTGSSRSISDD